MSFKKVDRQETRYPCISLIGMAGAGKSTLGALLAGRLGWSNVDTDRNMEAHYGLPLQSIMDRYGLDTFLEIEDFLLSRLYLHRTVISTGGSVVYGKGGMQQLKSLGPVVFLKIDLDTFLERVGDANGRGFAMAPGKTMEDVYNERQPLYEKYADLVCSTDDKSPEACVDAILDTLDIPE